MMTVKEVKALRKYAAEVANPKGIGGWTGVNPNRVVTLCDAYLKLLKSNK